MNGFKTCIMEYTNIISQPGADYFLSGIFAFYAAMETLITAFGVQDWIWSDEMSQTATALSQTGVWWLPTQIVFFAFVSIYVIGEVLKQYQIDTDTASRPLSESFAPQQVAMSAQGGLPLASLRDGSASAEPTSSAAQKCYVVADYKKFGLILWGVPSVLLFPLAILKYTQETHIGFDWLNGLTKLCLMIFLCGWMFYRNSPGSNAQDPWTRRSVLDDEGGIEASGADRDHERHALLQRDGEGSTPIGRSCNSLMFNAGRGFLALSSLFLAIIAFRHLNNLSESFLPAASAVCSGVAASSFLGLFCTQTFASKNTDSPCCCR